MEDMLKEFVVEALDLATNVEEHLLSLERNPGDMQTLNAVFRSFHTIKGGAGFMNLTAMVSACHLTENLFDALRTGKTAVTPLAIEAALEASGFVADQLSQLAGGTPSDALQPMPLELEQLLKSAMEGDVAAKTSVAAPAHAPVSATAPMIASDGIDWEILYQAVVPAGTSLPLVRAHQSATTPSTAWDGTDRRKNAEAQPGKPGPSLTEDSIRIDTSKLDALLEVAGESVQAANQASVLLEKLLQFQFDGDAAVLISRLGETLGRASRYSTELQRATLATRMQPVGRLFQRFPRLVRELAKELGKDVELVIEGAETEVDRIVVDSLYDPLVHMLRNSLDHGIESTDKRAASGKPAKSCIILKAWQAGSSVMIELADDGKGMDPLELRNKARAKGLITEAMASTDEDQGSGQQRVRPRRWDGRGENRRGKTSRHDPHRLCARQRHDVFDQAADRAVDRAYAARAYRRHGARDAYGGRGTGGGIAGGVRRSRRHAGHARSGPAAVRCFAGRRARLSSRRRTRRHRDGDRAALHPRRRGNRRHGGPGDQAAYRLAGRGHCGHRAFGRGRTGTGDQSFLSIGRLQGTAIIRAAHRRLKPRNPSHSE
jgi:HPt (histidine-containing phosphotransfer) domain-containing protein